MPGPSAGAPRGPEFVPGVEPGTFLNKETGELYALPSAFGEFRGFGPVSREEFDSLTARVDIFSASVTEHKPDAVANMIAQFGDYDDGGRKH